MCYAKNNLFFHNSNPISVAVVETGAAIQRTRFSQIFGGIGVNNTSIILFDICNLLPVFHCPI